MPTANSDKTVRIWAAEVLSAPPSTGQADRMRPVDSSPDGTWLATADGDKTDLGCADL